MGNLSQHFLPAPWLLAACRLGSRLKIYKRHVVPAVVAFNLISFSTYMYTCRTCHLLSFPNLLYRIYGGQKSSPGILLYRDSRMIYLIQLIYFMIEMKVYWETHMPVIGNILMGRRKTSYLIHLCLTENPTSMNRTWKQSLPTEIQEPYKTPFLFVHKRRWKGCFGSKMNKNEIFSLKPYAVYCSLFPLFVPVAEQEITHSCTLIYTCKFWWLTSSKTISLMKLRRYLFIWQTVKKKKIARRITQCSNEAILATLFI